jgi:hypothetical protein
MAGDSLRGRPGRIFRLLKGMVGRPVIAHLGEAMTTQEELLQRLWSRINSHVTPYYIGRALVREDELDRIVEHSKQRPDQPFADAGAAIERILAAGARRRGGLRHSL